MRLLIGAALWMPFALGQAHFDPEGIWTGTVTSPRARMPVIARFQKDAATGKFSGTITGYKAGEEVPLTSVQPKENGVEIRFPLESARGKTEAVLTLQYVRDALRGKTEVELGGQKMALDYELRRAPEGGAGIAEVGISPDESAEFQRIVAETDAATKKSRLDAFAARYPSSRLLAQAYQEGARLGGASGDLALMEEYGRKSLALWPDNFVLMTEIADAKVRRGDFSGAEHLALSALELLADALKPDAVGIEEWVKGRRTLMATNFATLGFVQLRRAQATDNRVERWRFAQRAVAPLKKALDYQPRDDYAAYGLGFAYVLGGDYQNAEASLAKAVALDGPLAADARKLLEDIYKTKNKTLEGLEQIIAKARSEMALP